MVGKHYSFSFSLPPPLEKGIPGREMRFISETAISYQVHGSRREKGWSTETQKDSRHNLNQSYVKLRPNTT